MGVCTIVLLHRVHPRYPVIVAANRDEFYARPTRPPEPLVSSPRAIGGVDVMAGGSWMGASERGLFVGLTNQRSETGRRPELRSRGEVVLGALAGGDRDGARAFLAGLDPRRYNPFNLVFGDAERLEVAYARADLRALEFAPVPPGIHVLPNDRLDSPGRPKVERARRLVEPLVELEWDRLRPALARALADHDRPPLAEVAAPAPGSPLSRELLAELESICIHTPTYGTRSQTILALEPERVAHYLFGDGPACAATLADVSSLLYPRA